MTKEEKIEVLQKVIKEVKTCHLDFSYICIAYDEVEGYFIKEIFKEIPELLEFKPKKTDTIDSWFPLTEAGRLQRIEVLEKTIKKLQE